MKPLCVDLDGTLIKTDLLIESIVNSFKKNPFNLYQMFLYGLKSKAHLKSKLSQESDLDIDIENLPYSSDVLNFLKEEASKRDLILTTGSNIRYAKLVSQHLGIFKEVLASSDEFNLTGLNKAKLLETKFGLKGFDYIGTGLEIR